MIQISFVWDFIIKKKKTIIKYPFRVFKDFKKGSYIT